MYKFYLLLLLFILFGHNTDAAKVPVIGGISFPDAYYSPDPPPLADFKTLIVPLKKAGNLIIIEATVDSLEGNFVLDTGAPYLVLNETYFRNSPHLVMGESEGINGPSASFTIVVHNFNILDLKYSRLTADVTDLSAIENGRGIKILGLLGTRLLSKFIVTVDLAKGVLYIQKPDRDGNIPETEKVYHNRSMVAPFRYLNDIIYLKAAVNGTNRWFAFDTGAETNLLDYDRSKNLVKSMQVINRSKVTGVGGTGFEVIYARFDQLVVGDHLFTQNHILLTDLEKMGKAYDHTVEGILGSDFFARGVFTINFVKKEFEMYIYNNQ